MTNPAKLEPKLSGALVSPLDRDVLDTRAEVSNYLTRKP